MDGLSFTLEAGGALGLVGECGSGKTTLGRMLVGLIVPTSGDLRHSVPPRALQMVFQDPVSSLNRS
ncbi:ATP-binding cassette domain-containing protein [Streptomyces sp. NBC_01262]|uniref:ATP-binding cassette domain-containing protein n=1 Tax=Streptomyces sp. NBC_01262 TaxID=2903803 RepID=UPI003FCEBE2F